MVADRPVAELLREALLEAKYFFDEDFPDGPDGPCAVTDRYRNAYKQILAALATGAAVPPEGWRSMEDAPKDGTRVLLWKEATKEHYVAAWMHGDHPGWCTPDGFEIFRATHWQRPPKPPAPPPAAEKEERP